MELHHDINIDVHSNINQALKQLDNIEASLKDVGAVADKQSKAFSDALASMANVGLDDLEATLNDTTAKFAKLREQYKKTQEAIKNAPLYSNERMGLERKLGAQEREMKEYANTIAAVRQRYDEYKTAADNAGQVTVSVRTRIRQLTNELNAMRLAGKQDTEEFRQLTAELGELATAQRETTNAMRMDSTGATQWHGMIEGVQGLMGAYSAASGVIGLFTKDQEKLMEVQTKMQSTMSILMGMQQVANTLHSTSTFRLRTLAAAQTSLNAAMTKYDLWLRKVRVSLHSFGLSAGAATVAMNALKVATMAFGGIAVVGITVALTKLVKNLKEQQEAARAAAEAQAQYNTAVAEGAGQPVAAFIEMRAKYNALADDMKAKKKFIDDNAEAFKKMGVEVKNINDLDNLMIKNADKYIAAQIAKAKADATREKFLANVKRDIELEQQLLNTSKTKKEYVQTGSASSITGGFTGTGGFYRDVDNPEYTDLKKEREKNREEMNGLLNDTTKFTEEYQKLMKEGLFTLPEGSDTSSIIKNLESAYKQFTDEFEKAKQKRDEENLKTELEKIEFRKELQLKALQEAYEAVKAQMEKAGKDTASLDAMYAQQSGFITESAKEASDAYSREQAESLRKQADEYASYYERRTAIEQKYAEEYEKYFNADGTLKAGLEGRDAEAMRANIAKEREETLAALDKSIGSSTDMFQVWCNRIVDASLTQLMGLISEAEVALETLEGEADASQDEIAAYRAFLAELKDRVKSGDFKTELTPGEQSVKDWEALHNVLNDCSSTFREIGDAVGGTVGDIMAAAGTITSGTVAMVGDIVRLTTISQRSVEETAKAGGAAVQAVEQASVILSIVSAALKIINVIKGAVDEHKAATAAAAQSAWEYARALEDVRRQSDLTNASTIFGSDAYGKMRVSMMDAVEGMKEYEQTVQNTGKTTLKTNNMLAKILGKSSAFGLFVDPTKGKTFEGDIIVDERTKWQKFIGSSKNITVKSMSDFYDETGKLNIDKLKAYYETYKDSMTEANRQAIDNILAEWGDVEESLKEVRDYLSDMFGELGGDISDALVDSFRNGTDAAEEFGKSLSKVVENWVQQMAYGAYLQPIFENMQKQVEDIVSDTGMSEEQRFEKMLESLANGMDEINDIQELYNRYLEGAKEAAADKGVNIFAPDEDKSGSRTGSKGGITTASQDTVDELNGRATAIQSHTFSIMESTKTLVSQCAGILDSLFRIETNTRRLESIESDMGIMRSTMTEIRDKGVNIRN